jgi:hypothetical protein
MTFISFCTIESAFGFRAEQGQLLRQVMAGNPHLNLE